VPLSDLAGAALKRRLGSMSRGVLDRMRCKVRPCTLRRRAVSETLRSQVPAPAAALGCPVTDLPTPGDVIRLPENHRSR
jgi:hypothetical protein